jgi:hypothetical protein
VQLAPIVALGTFLLLAIGSAPAQSPASLRPDLRARALRAVPFHRQGQREKFPIESLRLRLAEGIMATHPTMPQFRLDADQISDGLAYIETLQP